MKNRKVYMYVFDIMLDWEVVYLIVELNIGRYFKKGLKLLKVIIVGIDKNFIIIMGGLRVLFEIIVDEFNMESKDLLILLGGNIWLFMNYEIILEKVKEVLI